MRFLFILLLVSATALAQVSKKRSVKINEGNNAEQNFTQLPVRELLPAAELKRIPPSYQSHPDYGYQTYESHCTDCIELLHRRTETQRIFALPGKKDHLLVQAANGPLHWKDEQGRWRSIDPRLQATNMPGVYRSISLAQPIWVNTQTGAAGMEAGIYGNPSLMGEQQLRTFPQGKVLATTGSFLHDVTVGENGLRTAHNGPVGYSLVAGRENWESKLILNNRPNMAGGDYLVWEQTYSLPAGYVAQIDKINGTAYGDLWYADILIQNAAGQTIFIIKKSAIEHAGTTLPMDLPGVKLPNGAYSIKQENNLLKLSFFVDPTLLNHPSTVYPVVLDPVFTQLVNVNNPTATGASFNTFCNGNFIDVTIPGTYSEVDTYIYATYFSTQTNCGGGRRCEPSSARINIIGPCDSFLDNNCTFTTLFTECNLWTDPPVPNFSPCVTPQCTPYTMRFELQLKKLVNCGSNLDCATDCFYIPAGRSTVSLLVSTVDGEILHDNDNNTVYDILNNTTLCYNANTLNLGSGQYGVPPYTHNWTWTGGSSTQQTFTGTFTQTTTLTHTITDACGVVDDDVVQIQVLRQPTATLTKVNPTCSNNNGQISITALNPATPPQANETLQFSINGTTWQAGTTFAGLAAGTYNVRWRYQNFPTCTGSFDAAFVLPAYVAPNATVQLDPIICFGTANAQIRFTSPNGGFGTYEYSINGGTSYQSSPNFPNLAPATYNLRIRDAANPTCFTTINASYVVSQPPQLTATLSRVHNNCFGGTAGSITFGSPTGGSGPIDFSIDGGTTWVTTNVFNNLPAGIYNIYMRDRNNPTCTRQLQASYNITEPAVLAVTGVASTNNTSCTSPFTGSITFQNPSGGTSTSREFSINGGTTWQSSPTFNNLTGGTYNLRMRDALVPTCVVIVNPSLTLTQPPAPTATLNGSSILCFGAANGQIVLTNPANGQSGNYEVSLNGGTSWQAFGTGTFGSLTPGTYDVRIRDAAAPGCVTTLNGAYVITQPAQLTATPSRVNNTCFGATAGSITFGSPTGGSGPIDFSIDGGTSWLPGNVFNNLPAGTYNLYMRDRNNPTCTRLIQANYAITQPAVLAVTGVATTDNTTCNSPYTGSITFQNPSGGSSASREFSIDGGTTWQASPVFPNLIGGTYNLQMRDALAPTCVVTINPSLTIVRPNTPTATFNSNSITCNNAADGQIILTNPTNGQSGNYEVSLNGGTSWQPYGSGTFGSLAPGTYTVRLRDVAVPACVGNIATLVLNNPAPLNATVTPTDATCFGAADGRLDITGVPAATYEFRIDGGNWSMATSFTGLAAGSHTVEMRVEANPACNRQIATPVIGQPAQLVGTATPTAATVCNAPFDGRITITGAAGGSNTFEYSTNGTTWSSTLVGLAPGTYNVLVRDAAQTTCQRTLATGVVVGGAPSSFMGNDTVVCLSAGTFVPAAPTPSGGTYSSATLTVNSTTGTIDLSGVTAGTYTVSYAVAGFCTDNMQLEVQTNPDPGFALTPPEGTTQLYVNRNANVVLTISSPVPGAQYRIDWGDGTVIPLDPATTFAHTYTQPGLYTVTVYAEDMQGCFAQTSRQPVIIDRLLQGTFPNTFTPNEDGFNDYWEINFSGVDRIVANIFSRNGQLVFSKTVTGGQLIWDGKMNGEDLPAGAYFYTLELYKSVPVARKEDVTGNVTLLR